MTYTVVVYRHLLSSSYQCRHLRPLLSLLRVLPLRSHRYLQPLSVLLRYHHRHLQPDIDRLDIRFGRFVIRKKFIVDHRSAHECVLIVR
jgi:hypothetical protein